MDKVVNLGLLANPFNWAIVLLMVLTASLGVHFVTASAQSFIGTRNNA